jgi:rRNA endonuclease
MVSSKTLLSLAALATTAFATPAPVGDVLDLAPRALLSGLDAANPLAKRLPMVRCRNTAFPGGSFQIDLARAEGNIHAAPLGVKTTASGYPHEYTNRDGMRWTNGHCNNLKTGTILLEYPVFADGHQYGHDQGHPKPDPGAARAIYTSPSKDFCGVISHTAGNAGNFALCT